VVDAKEFVTWQSGAMNLLDEYVSQLHMRCVRADCP
jgi:hypothetical protein